jgi:hypothetical protein
VVQTVRRAILSPDSLWRIDDKIQEILDSFTSQKVTDEEKIKEVLERKVSPEILWRVIEPNREFFASPTEFEGGLVVESTIGRRMTLEQFQGSGIANIANCLLRIRNSLVHAREARLVQGISPTPANHQKLLPWTELLTTAAMELMIHDDS